MYAGLLPETNAFNTAFSKEESCFITFIGPERRTTGGYPVGMKEKLVARDSEKFRAITARAK